MAANVAEAMDGANLFQSNISLRVMTRPRPIVHVFCCLFFLAMPMAVAKDHAKDVVLVIFCFSVYLWTTTGIRPSPQIAPLVIHLVIHHREVRTVGNGAFGVVLL